MSTSLRSGEIVLPWYDRSSLVLRLSCFLLHHPFTGSQNYTEKLLCTCAQFCALNNLICFHHSNSKSDPFSLCKLSSQRGPFISSSPANCSRADQRILTGWGTVPPLYHPCAIVSARRLTRSMSNPAISVEQWW
jgi:hypothetical protein